MKLHFCLSDVGCFSFALPQHFTALPTDTPSPPPPLDFGLGTIVLRTKGFDGKTTLFKGFSGGDSLQRKEEIRYAGPTVSNYSWEVQY